MMETILVHAIDGTSVWVPVIAKRLNDSHYRIEASDHFDASDSSFLLEFIPGDVVELGSRQFTNGERHMVAVQSILRNVPYFSYKPMGSISCMAIWKKSEF
mgnify:CR=1 FL=1